MTNVNNLIKLNNSSEFEIGIALGIKGELDFFVMNTKNNSFQQLSQGQLQEIYNNYPHKKSVTIIPSVINNGKIINFHHEQPIGYQDLWIDKSKIELILHNINENKEIKKNKISASENEKQSLLKLIAVMAVDGYGYNHKASKSPLPTELATAIQVKLNISMDSDTIRKWLKEATSKYPPIK